MTGLLVRAPAETVTRKAPRRSLTGLTGKGGYTRVVRSYQNLAEWVLRVAALELGTRGLSAASVHHWIGYVGLFGFAISELLYEVRCIVGQIAGIQALWQKWCGTRRTTVENRTRLRDDRVPRVSAARQ